MYQACDILAGNLPGDDAHIALVHHDQAITTGELRQVVARFAQSLSLELHASELLAIDLPNGPLLLALILACFRTGIVPMPVSPDLKWPELKKILQSAKPQAFISHRTIASEQLEALDHCVQKIWFIANGRTPFPEPQGSCDTIATTPPDPERLTLVLHTSGSSGLPKGVKLAYRSLQHILEYRLKYCDLQPDGVAVVASCVSQTVGLYQCLAYLAAGVKTILLDSYELEAMVQTINQHTPSHLIMVVGAWDKLLHHSGISPESLRHLRFASAGADKLTARVQERFIALTGRPLRSSYGLTESSWAMVNSAPDVKYALALGNPSPGVEIRLLDSAGRQVAPGEVGQIHIRSPRNLLGYLHDADALCAILKDGWLMTGDLAWQDDEGVYWFASRSKDMIVLASGDNVSPAEVEAALCAHPAVQGCVVAGGVSETGSVLPWAWVVPAGQVSAQELQEFLRERLSDHKVPAGFEFVTSLPTGLSGKIQRSVALPTT